MKTKELPMDRRERGGEIVHTVVWELPVRISHWALAASIVALGITGYLIGDPIASAPAEASRSYSMGTTRAIHLISGYVLLASLLLRLYWGFAGNSFCRWTTMLPLTWKRWRAIGEELRELAYPRGKFHVFRGHSPLGSLSYLIAYAGAALAAATGFVLHSQGGSSAFWRWTAGWGLWVFGGNLNTVRLIHHLLLWFFALFFIAHLYLVVFTVVVSRTTEVDTMISGKKYVHREEVSAHSD